MQKEYTIQQGLKQIYSPNQTDPVGLVIDILRVRIARLDKNTKNALHTGEKKSIILIL